MLINREGFIPDSSYENFLGVVRTGIDLTTRVRAAVTAPQREHRRAIRGTSSQSGVRSEAPSFSEVLGEATNYMSRARQLMVAGDKSGATRQADRALEHIKRVSAATDEFADEAAMLRVLASAGTQLSSFVHE
jgi:hypothetical protein